MLSGVEVTFNALMSMLSHLIGSIQIEVRFLNKDIIFPQSSIECHMRQF